MCFEYIYNADLLVPMIRLGSRVVDLVTSATLLFTTIEYNRGTLTSSKVCSLFYHPYGVIHAHFSFPLSISHLFLDQREFTKCPLLLYGRFLTEFNVSFK